MRTKLFLLLGTAMAALMLPVTVGAGELVHFKGQYASAYFQSSENIGEIPCIYTYVYLSAYDGATQHPPGPGVSESSLNLVVDRYDYCNWISLMSLSEYVAALPAADFTMTGQNLASARLTTAVNGTNWADWLNPVPVTITIDVTWTPVTPAQRGNYHEHNQGPGFIANFRANGTYRQAEASGTVTDDTTNFIPEVSLGAAMGLSRAGSLYIEKKQH